MGSSERSVDWASGDERSRSFRHVLAHLLLVSRAFTPLKRRPKVVGLRGEGDPGIGPRRVSTEGVFHAGTQPFVWKLTKKTAPLRTAALYEQTPADESPIVLLMRSRREEGPASSEAIGDDGRM